MARTSWRFRFVRFLARMMLKSQYRVIEVEGADRIPATGAVLLLANHFSSLVDSMALLEASPRPASFLAKAPLWKLPFLAWFLEALEALPVYRPQDIGENEGRTARANVKTFEACRERLAAGGSLALFPEGVSQPRPRLMPIRTGAARMALDAGVPVTICPAGLIYGRSSTGRRGTLLVTFGEPFTVDGVEGFASRREAITDTTRRMESSLKELLAEAPSQGDLEAIRTLRVVWDQEEGNPAPRTLAEGHRRSRVFARSLVGLRERAPELLEELRAEADDYMRALDANGVLPEKLQTRHTTGRVVRFLAKNLPLAIVGVPLGIVAAVVTWPIRHIGDLVALRMFGGSEDLRALCRMLGAGLLLVVLMALGAVFAFFQWGLWPALVLLVGLPALLAFHVVWRDHGLDLLNDVRSFFLLAGGNLRGELLKQRRAVYAVLKKVEERLSASAAE